MSTRLILIRHGQTDWNLEKRYMGFTDMDLNETGMAQGAMLAKKLEGERIDKIYSSDLKRAFNFASIVFKGFDITKMTGLREMGFGIFEGLSYSELMKRYSDIYKGWLDDPFKAAIPEGENADDFRRRAISAFRTILESNADKRVAVVSHAGPIRAFVANITGEKDMWKVPADPAGLTIINFNRRKRPEVAAINDTSCLSRLESDRGRDLAMGGTKDGSAGKNG